MPTLVAGPALYVLFPLVTQTDMGTWLDDYHLSKWSLVLMIPYFGLVHPLLEQIHWQPLRTDSGWSHPAFAGYHLIVLWSLLSIPWLLLCFVLLTGASFAWKWMASRQNGSLTAPMLSHIFADLSLVVATWMLTQ